MKAAYFQSIGGASGDMALGALVDAGVPLDTITDAMRAMNVRGVQISAEQAQRGGVIGTHIRVELDDEATKTRSFDDFIAAVNAAALPERVKEQSTAVFRRMADAEAQVHRTTADHLHLHELGTLDTLVDVVGAVAGLDALGVERVFASPFPMGTGVFRSAHGILPVPSPATSALFGMANAPLVPAPNNPVRTGEMVTPTGAGIITTLAEFRQPLMAMSARGYGLGTRDPDEYPNVLALWIGELLEGQTGIDAAPAPSASSGLSLLETNIDDTTGEVLGYVQERLLSIGARDVWFAPIQMKKNRPATMLCAIVDASAEREAADLIMRETTTLGIRVRPVRRYEANREIRTVQTPHGPAAVKLKLLDGEIVSASPEYEDCRRIAADAGITLREAYAIVERESRKSLGSQN